MLIVRLGSLGDIIHTIPAAAAIRRTYPNAAIDWLVDVRHRELLDLVPVVDRKIAIETSNVGSSWSAVGELRRANYDAALDLQGLVKSAVLARLSGAARVVGFPTELLRERAARVFYTETAGDPEPHVIDKNLSMLRAIGVRMPDVAFPLEDRNPGIAGEARSRLGLAGGSALRSHQSRRRLAEQAVAAGIFCGVVARARQTPWPPFAGPVGTGRAAARRRSCDGIRQHCGRVPADDRRRPCVVE